MQELPGLEQIYQEYIPDTLRIFAVNTLEDLLTIAWVRSQLGLTFALLKGQGTSVVFDYHISGVPFTLIVDRTGRVYYYKLGYTGGVDLITIRQKLNQLFQPSKK